jgi:hypothetical protein
MISLLPFEKTSPFSRALTHSRPEILGNLVILLPESLRIALLGPEDDLLPERQYILE